MIIASFNGGGEIRRTVSVVSELCEIQISVSVSKVLWNMVTLLIHDVSACPVI